jgi:hypothetical protein
MTDTPRKADASDVIGTWIEKLHKALGAPLVEGSEEDEIAYYAFLRGKSPKFAADAIIAIRAEEEGQ